MDSIPPVVTCPPDVSSVIEIGTGPTTVSLPIPTVSDNSLMEPTLVTQSPSGNIFGVGVTPVTFTYQDLAGNVNSCTFTVTVTEGKEDRHMSHSNFAVGMCPHIVHLIAYRCHKGNDVMAESADLWSRDQFCSRNIVVYPRETL